MKNMKLMLGGFAILFLATGCGTQTLTCSMEEDGQSASLEAIYDSKGETLQKLEMDMTLDFDGYYTEDELKEQDVEDFCSEFGMDGFECEASVDGTKVLIELLVDAETADKDELEDMGFNDSGDIEFAKESLEDEGFKCE